MAEDSPQCPTIELAMRTILPVEPVAGALVCAFVGNGEGACDVGCLVGNVGVRVVGARVGFVFAGMDEQS